MSITLSDDDGASPSVCDCGSGRRKRGRFTPYPQSPASYHTYSPCRYCRTDRPLRTPSPLSTPTGMISNMTASPLSTRSGSFSSPTSPLPEAPDQPYWDSALLHSRSFWFSMEQHIGAHISWLYSQ